MRILTLVAILATLACGGPTVAESCERICERLLACGGITFAQTRECTTNCGRMGSASDACGEHAAGVADCLDEITCDDWSCSVEIDRFAVCKP